MAAGRCFVWTLVALVITCAAIFYATSGFFSSAPPDKAQLDRRGGFLQLFNQQQLRPHAPPLPLVSLNASQGTGVGRLSRLHGNGFEIAKLLRERGKSFEQASFQLRFSACFNSDTACLMIALSMS